MKKTNLLLLLVLLSGAVHAQLPALTAPTSYADTYPVANSNMTANSCYSMQNAYFNGNYYDLYVSGWSSFGSSPVTGKLVWRIMQQNTYPPIAYSQGQLDISGTDIEVGILNINNTMYLQAAYLRTGAGFVLDRYVWNGSSFVFFSTINLSVNAAGKKINMDMYGSWETAIVWSEYNPPANNYLIKCRLGRGLDLTQTITLNNTTGTEHPDVAVSKNEFYPNAGIDAVAAEIVYTKNQENATGHTSQIIVAVMPFEAVFTANPAIYTPIVEDVNNLGQSNVYPRASIDCPDLSEFTPYADWAYVYNSDQGLKMRVKKQGTGMPPVTKNLVDGSGYGIYNINFSPTANHEPTIAYGTQGQSIHAGWMCYGPPVVNYAGLLAIEVSNDGNTLLSPPDYQVISTNSTASSPQFSKNSFYSSFLYTIYSQNNALRHVFHVYGSPSFKGQPTAVAGNQILQEKIGVAPNPFYNNVRLIVPAALRNESVRITITDMLGRTQFEGIYNGQQLEAAVQPRLRELPSGTYLLYTGNTALHYNQQQKIVKAQ